MCLVVLAAIGVGGDQRAVLQLHRRAKATALVSGAGLVVDQQAIRIEVDRDIREARSLQEEFVKEKLDSIQDLPVSQALGILEDLQQRVDAEISKAKVLSKIAELKGQENEGEE